MRSDLSWHLDLDEGIDLAIYLFGAFEPRMIDTYRRIVTPGDTVLDIGANIGAHTLHFARAVGSAGRVFAFEPTAYAYAKLQRNVSLNVELAARIRTENVLLEDRTTDGALSAVYSSWPLTGQADLHPKHLGKAMDISGAERVSLDAFMESRQVERIDFIKMDVDGNECRVLRGALSTLRKHRPEMILELVPYGLAERGDSTGEFVDILKSLGYRLTNLSDGKLLPHASSEVNAQIPDGCAINVLAQSK